MKLDHRAEIFMNLNGAQGEIGILYYLITSFGNCDGMRTLGETCTDGPNKVNKSSYYFLIFAKRDSE